MVFALAVLVAHGFGGRETVAEALLEDAERLVDPRFRPMLDRPVYLQAHPGAPRAIQVPANPYPLPT